MFRETLAFNLTFASFGTKEMKIVKLFSKNVIKEELYAFCQLGNTIKNFLWFDLTNKSINC